MIFEVYYGETSLHLEGFGPNTVIGALQDILQEDGTMQVDGAKVDKVVIHNDREPDAAER